MSHSEAGAYHALSTSLHGDHGALAKLRRTYGSWSDALKAEGGPEPTAAWYALAERGLALLLSDDPVFPPLLREIPVPPWGIYVQGDVGLLARPSVAIVGTRKVTEPGRRLAAEFAAAFARAGLPVVSGLAFGVDAAAHEGALREGGRSVAVLANGLPDIYPAHHLDLGTRLLGTGALVSEYPPGEPPLPRRFLERNRIVSGLCRGVVVIEAPERSGSLATARFALEQNREVFVLPGPARHPNYRGSHQLIRAGAELVTSPEEVLEALGIEASRQKPEAAGYEGDEALVMAALLGASAPLAIDRIIELTHLEPRVALRTLSFLIIKKRVAESGGGYMVC